MRTAPMIGFTALFFTLVALGIFLFTVVQRRAKELDSPKIVKKDDGKTSAAKNKKAAGADKAQPAEAKEWRRDDDIPKNSVGVNDASNADAVAMMSLTCTAISILIALVLYLLPTFVALKRNHNNLAGVAVLNIFLGWTGWFWVLALVWAVWNHAPGTHRHEHRHIHYHD